MRRAKYASETAVEPLDASTTGAPGLDPAVTQRVEEERAGEAVLEAPGGVRGLVLEVEMHVPVGGEREAEEVGVGAAVGVGLHLPDGLLEPGPVGGIAPVCVEGVGGDLGGARRGPGRFCSGVGDDAAPVEWAREAARGLMRPDPRPPRTTSHLHKHLFEGPKHKLGGTRSAGGSTTGSRGRRRCARGLVEGRTGAPARAPGGGAGPWCGAPGPCRLHHGRAPRGHSRRGSPRVLRGGEWWYGSWRRVAGAVAPGHPGHTSLWVHRR